MDFLNTVPAIATKTDFVHGLDRLPSVPVTYFLAGHPFAGEIKESGAKS